MFSLCEILALDLVSGLRMLVKAVFDSVQDIRPAYFISVPSISFWYTRSFAKVLIIAYRIRQIIWWHCRYFNIIIAIWFVRFHWQRSVEHISKHWGTGALGAASTMMCARTARTMTLPPSIVTTALGAYTNSSSSCSPDEAITCPIQPRKLNSAWKPPKRRKIRFRSLTKSSERIISG